jgi:hypothetical protein
MRWAFASFGQTREVVPAGMTRTAPAEADQETAEAVTLIATLAAAAGMTMTTMMVMTVATTMVMTMATTVATTMMVMTIDPAPDARRL